MPYHGMGYGGGMPGRPRDPRMQGGMPQMGNMGYATSVSDPGSMMGGMGQLPQVGMPGAGPGGGGYGGMGLGDMFGGMQQRPIGGLDYMQMGASALTDFGNWWETREERHRKEREDEAMRAERQQRRTEMGQAWRAANAGIGG